MKTLFFECNMGAAGDMIMSALLELCDSPQDFIKKLNSIGIPGVVVTAEKSVKCGISGTYIDIKINENHEHIHHEQLINSLNISQAVKTDALAVYKILADAESRVHGVPVEQIHFHEIGEIDAVADIVGVCMLLEELAPDIILSSPVHVGSGQVRCAHGILPVPAPATAQILRDVPIYGGDICAELCTPTGAALLKYFAKSFGAMPIMKTSKIGYGMGKKDFEAANCLRVFIGESSENNCEEVVELVCNLDDMTPEAAAFAQQILLEEGALDAYTSPINMKKGRQGIRFAVICRHDLKEKFLRLIFKHTTTLGVREIIHRRHVLAREINEVETPHGTLRVKTSQGFGTVKTKPEYDDIARIAREKELSFSEVAGSF
jgi:hypothetical protein